MFCIFIKTSIEKQSLKSIASMFESGDWEIMVLMGATVNAIAIVCGTILGLILKEEFLLR